jgi:hypothetical protein
MLGTVQFAEDETNIGSAIPVTNDEATLTTALSTGGNHSITATYSGDSTYSESVSESFPPHRRRFHHERDEYDNFTDRPVRDVHNYHLRLRKFLNAHQLHLLAAELAGGSGLFRESQHDHGQWSSNPHGKHNSSARPRSSSCRRSAFRDCRQGRLWTARSIAGGPDALDSAQEGALARDIGARRSSHFGIRGRLRKQRRIRPGHADGCLRCHCDGNKRHRRATNSTHGHRPSDHPMTAITNESNQNNT